MFRGMLFSVVFVVCLLLHVSGAIGYYFLVDSSRSCYNFEQPKNVPVAFTYEILDANHAIEFGLYYGASLINVFHYY